MLLNPGITPEIYSSLSEQEKSMLSHSLSGYSLKKEFRSKIKVVLTGGVFDIIHMGHIYTLTQAKKLGDILIVAIAKDSHISKKGRKPIHSQEYRANMVEMLKPVDLTILGMEKPEDLVSKVHPNIIVYGYDQPDFIKPEGVEIIKLTESVDKDNLKTQKIIDKFGL